MAKETRKDVNLTINRERQTKCLILDDYIPIILRKGKSLTISCISKGVKEYKFLYTPGGNMNYFHNFAK